MNLVCVICQNSLISFDDAFSTPCGHMFHHGCLLQWLERSKACPQCHKSTTKLNIHRIYFSSGDDSFVEGATFSKKMVDHAILKKWEDKINKLEKMTTGLEQLTSAVTRILNNNRAPQIEQYCKVIDEYKNYNKQFKKIANLLRELKNQLNICETEKISPQTSQLLNKQLLNKQVNMHCVCNTTIVPVGNQNNDDQDNNFLLLLLLVLFLCFF